MAFNFNMNLDKIKEDLKKSQKTSSKDDRFWKVTADKEGNALVLFRFVPDKNGEIFAKYYEHYFPYMTPTGKKYWHKKCINTFGYEEGCPICAKNMEYWNSPYEEDKKIASQRKRKMLFISNIMIIQDKTNPENEGKVFLYKYGKHVYDKIKARLMPTEQDLADPDFKAFNPFHPIDGATFKLKVYKEGEYPNYTGSSFSIPKPLFDGDVKKIEEIIEKTYILEEFVKPDTFPTNELVMRVLGSILGGGEVKNDTPETTNENVDPKVENTTVDEKPVEMKKTEIPVEEKSFVKTPKPEDLAEIDEDMEFFKNLK